jgi:D-alanyl-D-alanine carboxypeptidase
VIVSKQCTLFGNTCWQQSCLSPHWVINLLRAFVVTRSVVFDFTSAVLIAQHGEIIFEQSYGWANRSYDVPNQVDTKFNLGSMNKMFTAVAIMQLVQQGKLAADDKIIQHIPDYPNQQVANKVTIHHLLTHTSGLGDFFTHEFFETSRDQIRTLTDYLALFVDRPLQFEPGARLSYSNVGYIVLGLIIEQVTGQSYFDYVRENIFEPCGMPNTDSYATDQIVPNLATGYSTRLSDEGELRSNILDMPGKGSSAGGGYSTLDISLDSGHTIAVLSNSDGCSQVVTYIRVKLLNY